MASGDEWEDLIDGEIFDCSSLSIAYQTTGIAQISFTVYRPKDEGLPYTAGGPGFELCAGGVNFKGWVNDQTLVPDSDSDFYEWRVSAEAIGCKVEGGCASEC